MLINKNGIRAVEEAVVTGGVLFLSRRPNSKASVYNLKEKGYVVVEEKKDKYLWRWNDQFPVQVKWENTQNVRVYNPGAIIHVVSKT